MFDGGLIHILYFPFTVPPSFQQSLVDELGLSTDTDLLAGTVMLEALEAANLLPELQSMRDVTVVVPLDSAFYTVGSIFDGMSIDTLRSILQYHIIPNTDETLASELLQAPIEFNRSFKSLQGTNLTLAWIQNHCDSYICIPETCAVGGALMTPGLDGIGAGLVLTGNGNLVRVDAYDTMMWIKDFSLHC